MAVCRTGSNRHTAPSLIANSTLAQSRAYAILPVLQLHVDRLASSYSIEGHMSLVMSIAFVLLIDFGACIFNH